MSRLRLVNVDESSGLENGSNPGPGNRWLEASGWLFVVLGMGLRIYRVLLDFPLWGDEAFLAMNIISRGYRELLRPLAFGQVCPPLFLWVERFVIGRIGVSEFSLRLFPLACGLASVPLFHRLASRAVDGLPHALAVAIFAVSFHPIRQSAEVKPYASDLLISLVLLFLALEWLRDRDRQRGLWALIALVALALGLSHPAVFVAGGVALALFLPAWRSGSRTIRVLFVGYLFMMCGTFVAIYLVFLGPQNQVHLAGLRGYWANSFPPLGSLPKFLKWLVLTHTGTMFAYPGGSKDGGSTATLLLFLAGVWVLANQRRWTILVLFLAPFGLAFFAAVLGRYPYGGETRQMQFLVPSICLLSGIGGARLISKLPRWNQQMVAAALVGLLLIVTGVIPLALDARHPYRRLYDKQARDFAHRFWPELERRGEVASLEWDYGVQGRRTTRLKTALFLCNAIIQSPRRQAGRAAEPSAVSPDHPFLCILHEETRLDAPGVVEWRKAMSIGYTFRPVKTIDIPMSDGLDQPKIEHCYLFELVPKNTPHH